jgi:hypothetical protein
MRFLSDENFNGAILRGLMRRLPKKPNTALEPTSSKAIFKSQRSSEAAQLDRWNRQNENPLTA